MLDGQILNFNCWDASLVKILNAACIFKWQSPEILPNCYSNHHAKLDFLGLIQILMKIRQKKRELIRGFLDFWRSKVFRIEDSSNILKDV